jgi:hypothetical protein
VKFLLAIAALAATCTAFAQGTSEAILDYTASISAYVDTTVGWTFQTTNALTVTELGCFTKVFDDNAAVSAIQVGLWDHNGSLLVSNSITAGSILFDQTRYESITPVSLDPGQTYHLGVYYSGGSIGLDAAVEAFGDSVSTAAEVQLGASAVASAGFASPQEVDGTSGSIYAGPNFRFLSQPKLAIQLWPVNQVRLSWPTAYPGYTLQSKLGLLGVWAGTGVPVTATGNQFVAFDPIGTVPKYYRLAKQDW